jgi:hypothetical protein
MLESLGYCPWYVTASRLQFVYVKNESWDRLLGEERCSAYIILMKVVISPPTISWSFVVYHPPASLPAHPHTSELLPSDPHRRIVASPLFNLRCVSRLTTQSADSLVCLFPPMSFSVVKGLEAFLEFHALRQDVVGRWLVERAHEVLLGRLGL